MKPDDSKDWTGWQPVRRACLLLVLLTGCLGVGTEEAEHHTPEHKPVDFPAAVERLLELHVEIGTGSSRQPDQLDVFAELRDIARWLPDLAADSDLKEKPWNRVDAASRRLDAILAAVLARADDERREAYLSREAELDQQRRELMDVKRLFSNSGRALAADE